jgi:hypothetical protein
MIKTKAAGDPRERQGAEARFAVSPAKSERQETVMDVRYFADVERDDLIAELWDGDLNWGQITIDRTTGKFTLEIFISMDGASKAFDLQEVQVALERAEHRLLELEIQRLFPS